MKIGFSQLDQKLCFGASISEDLIGELAVPEVKTHPE